jgi:hypothetical protein
MIKLIILCLFVLGSCGIEEEEVKTWSDGQIESEISACTVRIQARAPEASPVWIEVYCRCMLVEISKRYDYSTVQKDLESIGKDLEKDGTQDACFDATDKKLGVES